jgi:hypothetical protein
VLGFSSRRLLNSSSGGARPSPLNELFPSCKTISKMHEWDYNDKIRCADWGFDGKTLVSLRLASLHHLPSPLQFRVINGVISLTTITTGGPRPPPHLYSFPLLSRALTIVVSSEATNLPLSVPPAPHRCLELVPRISPLLPSSSRWGRLSHTVVSVARRWDRAQPPPLLHSEPPQSTKFWTWSMPIS